ncbi:MAG: cytochrome c maturation protein CcmE [Pseudomonadota bacterium]
MKPVKRNQRILYLGIGGVALAAAAGLTFTALSQNIDYFYTPGDVVAAATAGTPLPDRRIRLGGLVAEGTVRDGTGVKKIFDVTDGKDQITVSYDGILPDLFSEGQGVIAQGRFQPDGLFKADIILAKHDENYEPKELVGIAKDPVGERQLTN